MPTRSENELVRRCRELLPKLGKRPRTVLERILERGSVSTYELGQLGYDQPPRAAQDLKEAGVRLTTTFGKHPTTGARMGIYSLAGLDTNTAFNGRVAFPKAFRTQVIDHFGSRCNICNIEYPSTVLQLDHRVPYIVAGEASALALVDFQALCGSHQRTKSWECEHCPNRSKRDVSVCGRCYWARPDGAYDHIATRPERRVDVTWTGEEMPEYARLKDVAKRNGATVPELIKDLVERYLKS